MENTCFFVGNVTKKPTMSTSKKGNDYCAFTIVNKNHKSENYINLVCFGEIANELINDVNANSLIMVDCYVRTRAYNGGQDISFIVSDYHVINVSENDSINIRETSSSTNISEDSIAPDTSSQVNDDDLKAAASTAFDNSNTGQKNDQEKRDNNQESDNGFSKNDDLLNVDPKKIDDSIFNF